MTADSRSIFLVQTTDAEFRAWGSAINAALTAIGLVQTSDTGQINWTTVTRAVGSNTAQGYEIWRMNDTSQSTCPIYLKLEYGSGSAAANPSMWITVGTGSNGSGSITGTTIQARSQFANTSGADSAPRTMYACAQDGVFWIVLCGGAGTPLIGAGFGFSRFCNANGVANTDGGYLWYYGFNSTSPNHIIWYRPGSVVRTASPTIPAIPSGGTSGVYGANVAVYESVAWSDRPCRVFGLLGAWRADFSPGATVVITAYGSSRTFIGLNGTRGPGNMDYGSTSNVSFLGVYS